MYTSYEINAAIYLKENKCKIKSGSEYGISWLLTDHPFKIYIAFVI